MIYKLPAYLKNKIIVQLIIALCLLVIALGYAGIIAWTSPAEKIAEDVLQAETGVTIKPNS